MALTTQVILSLTMFLAIFTVMLAVVWLVRRWQQPAQQWLSDSTEQSLADFLIYLPVKVFWTRLLTALIPLLIGLAVWTNFGIAISAAFGTVVVVILAKKHLLARRHKLITKQLPDGLDMLVTATSAGLSFHAALDRSINQLPVPLRHEWQQLVRRTRTGEGIYVALLYFYQRVPTEAVLQVLLTVHLGLQHGSQQAQILQRLAESLRQQHYAIERVKSLSAQARMQGKVMLLLPIGLFAVLHYLHPENTRILTQTTAGHYLLAACLLLMVVGQTLIKKVLGSAYAR